MKKIFVFLLGIALFSCKKDKHCNQDMGGASGPYRVTAAKYKASASSTEQDYLTTLFPNACERDDIVTLNANGNYTLTDAGVKCSPAGDDTGTWSINSTTFTIDGDPYTVASFDCSGMVITQSNYFTTGDQMKITLTKQ